MSWRNLLGVTAVLLMITGTVTAGDEPGELIGDSTEVFVAMLDDPDPAMRTAGLAGLWADLWVKYSGADIFLEMTRDPDEHVQRLAVFMFLEAVPYDDERRAVLLENEEKWIRLRGVDNIRYSAWMDPDLSHKIIGMLDDPEIEVAQAVARNLHRMGPLAEPAIPRLVSLTDQEFSWDAQPFVEAIAGLAEYSVPYLRKLLNEATEADGRFQGVLKIVEAMGPRASGLAPDLMELVRVSDTYIGFSMASDALGSVSAIDEDLIEQIVELAAQTSGVPRSAAIDALGLIGTRVGSQSELLWQYTKDESRPVRISAVRALGAISYKLDEHLDELFELARDSELGEEAAMILSSLPVQPLDRLLILFDESDDETRKQIFDAIEAAEPDASVLVQLLMTLMGSENDETVYVAARQLRLYGDEAAPAVPRLIELLESGNSALVEMAIWVLAAIGPEAEPAVPVLEKLVEHPIFGNTADWAIVMITEKDSREE